MANGDMVEDGDGWLRDQNGKLIKDKNGNPIGAEGIETGLLNILNGGTSNKDYSDFSDAEIQAAQKLMIDAGFAPSEVENFKNRMWNSGNDGKTIKAGSTLDGFGSTVATSVFMNGYDEMTDNVIFSNDPKTAVDNYLTVMSRNGGNSIGRYLNYLQAKESFWSGNHDIVSDPSKLHLSEGGGFRKASGYPDNQHRAVDIGGPEGSELLAMFGGKVVGEKFNTTSSGFSSIIEHGFNFEGTFYSTGIQSQQMHFMSESPLSVGDMVNAETVVGYMGNTGKSDGIHVHPQFMSNIKNEDPYSQKWDMLDRRRNVFLDFINAPKTWDDEPTSSENSYSDFYDRFYYNPTNFFNEMLK